MRRHIHSLAFLLIPTIAVAKDIEGDFLCLTSSGQFDAKLSFKGDGFALLDFVTQEMVEQSPDLQSQLGIPAEYEIKGSILVLSFYDGFQKHAFELDEFTMSSQSMGLNNCVRQS
ncbi:MAG: hypothetical protein ABJM43_00460 [Paracoccaceae bacterium]